MTNVLSLIFNPVTHSVYFREKVTGAPCCDQEVVERAQKRVKDDEQLVAVHWGPLGSPHTWLVQTDEIYLGQKATTLWRKTYRLEWLGHDTMPLLISETESS